MSRRLEERAMESCCSPEKGQQRGTVSGFS